MTDLQPLTSFDVSLAVTIRVMQRGDVRRIEWRGEFSHFRNLFKRSYREQQRGNRLLLVADVNGEPIGRLFIQFNSHNKRIADGQTRGYLYSFQVMNLFRGCGIGTRLMAEAETTLQQRGFTHATIAVAKDNIPAQRLYQRLGYQRFGESAGQWRFLDHKGRIQDVDEPSYLLEKKITM